MDQINENFSFYTEKAISLTPVEIGEYSIYVKKDIENAAALKIGNVVSREIVSSPEGSIIYFDKKIPESVKIGLPMCAVAWYPPTLTFDELLKFSQELFTNEESGNNGLY